MLGCSPQADLIPRETGWFTHGQSAEEILADLRHLPGVPIEKTPNHLFHLGSIGGAFPNARIAAVTRHPLDTVSSLLARFGDIDRAVQLYLTYTQRLVEAVGEGALHAVVPLERTIEDPRGMLEELCPRLELAYSAEMLEHHRHAPAWFGVQPAEVPDGEGPEHERLRAWQVRQPIFDHRGRWRDNLDRAEADRVVRLVGPVAERLGYDPRSTEQR
jgi:hypothetical protein